MESWLSRLMPPESCDGRPLEGCIDEGGEERSSSWKEGARVVSKESFSPSTRRQEEDTEEGWRLALEGMVGGSANRDKDAIAKKSNPV